MRHPRLIAVAFLFCAGASLLTIPAHASDAGTTSANFLKLGIGPRAVAMGEAQVGLADDVYATYWNPAGLAQLRTPEAGFMYNQYFQDINQQYVAYAHPTPTLGTFAGSINFLNIGKFDSFDAVGQPTGQVGASDLALGLSYAKALWQDRRMDSELAVGGTGKYIREKLDTVSASAYAVDGGVFFKPGKMWGDFWDGWRTGLAIRNLGSGMKFDTESFSLPRSIDAGLSWTGKILNELVTVTADGEQPKDGSRSLGAGLEVWTLKNFILRTGYTNRGDFGNGFRAGAGLRLRTLEIDYAYAGAGDFGAIHRIGLTLRFSPPKRDPQAVAEEWYLKGSHEYKEGRYTDALVDFNKALEIDPSHPQALQKMHETYDKLKTITPDQP